MGCPNCTRLNSDVDRPRPLALELVHIGNNIIHHSHKINIFEGLVYCRKCGRRVSHNGIAFIKNLAKPCAAPSGYGIDCLKRISKGLRPRQVGHWPCDELSRRTQQRIVEAPISEFESQVLSDQPELSIQEAKIVASTLLRCSEYANQFGALLNMHAESSACDGSNASSSTAERLSLSGPRARQLDSSIDLVTTPATPDLSNV